MNDCKEVPDSEEQAGVLNTTANIEINCGNQSILSRVSCLVDASYRQFETVFDALGEGVVFQNRKGQILISNDAAAQILGLTPDQLEGRTSVDPRWQALKEDGSPFPGEEHPAMVSLRTGVRQSNVLMNVLKPDGTRTWIKINSIPVFDGGDSEPIAVVCSFCDITAVKESELDVKGQLKILQDVQAQIEARRRGLEIANQELREAADIDTLTGLKNQKGLFERLASDVALASRNQFPISLLILEVDPFDTSNSDMLNEVLVQVSRAMKATGRASDFVARYRDDRFAMVLPYTNEAQAVKFAHRLLEVIQEIESYSIVIACIGVAEYRMGTLTNNLVEQAEEALFRAKASGQRTLTAL